MFAVSLELSGSAVAFFGTNLRMARMRGMRISV